jgi:dTDP-4-dehydrorhamnose reductase
VKILITGVSGLLGLNAAMQLRHRSEVVGCYHANPIEFPGVCTLRCDVTDGDAVDRLVERERPHVIFHAAGLANVDHCETDQQLAFAMNVSAAALVARAAVRTGARLVHISTDHVFDGSRGMWTEHDPVHPLNEYARTKWEGERQVIAACPDALVVRTNFYGWGTSRRESFSDWIVRGLESGQPLRMFDDVFFTPLLVNDLIDRTMDLLARGATGVMHVSGPERLSKYEFGLRIARAFGLSATEIMPVSIAAANLAARRPRDMSLDSARAAAAIGTPARTLDAGLLQLRQQRESDWCVDLQRASAV